MQVAAAPTRTIDHPLVGRIELRAETLAIVGAEGQLLIVYQAKPGRPSERALTRLSDLAAGEHREYAEHRPSSQ